MRTTPFLLGFTLAIMGLSGAATAAELRVIGRANPNGDFMFESNMSDIETGAPLTRTSISVADSQAGVFEYSALADITTPKLQVVGTLNNTGGSVTNPEAQLLTTFASLEDTVTFNSTIVGPYDITVQLIVHGLLDVDGSDGVAIAFLQVEPQGQLSSSGQGTYNTNGPVSDTISLTRSFTGNAVFDVVSNLQFRVGRIDAATSITGDFGATAIINIILPEGVTLQGSESGAFGTAPIPVPAALPLMISALAGLWWTRRRR